MRCPVTNYRIQEPAVLRRPIRYAIAHQISAPRGPPIPLSDTVILLLTAGRAHALLFCPRSTQSCFSQINPIVKNKIVQICAEARRTSSLTATCKMLIRTMSVETANCPPDPFKHLSARTKFRSQINKKKAVPIIPSCKKNSRRPLWAFGITNTAQLLPATAKDISIARGCKGDQNAQNPQPSIGLSRIASMT